MTYEQSRSRSSNHSRSSERRRELVAQFRKHHPIIASMESIPLLRRYYFELLDDYIFREETGGYS